jgi:hypothetical protein
MVNSMGMCLESKMQATNCSGTKPTAWRSVLQLFACLNLASPPSDLGPAPSDHMDASSWNFGALASALSIWTGNFVVQLCFISDFICMHPSQD